MQSDSNILKQEPIVPPHDVPRLGLFLLAYLVLVAYGSFVPFDLRVFSLADAWEHFQRIRYLNLSAGSRADWIANILLYIPIGMLGAVVWFRAREPRAQRMLKAILIVVLAIMFAVAIEFLQVYFAPRTVSYNDLLAESIGSTLGVAGWFVAGGRIRGLIAHLGGSRENAVLSALVLYAIAYGLLALFPYDIVVSFAELSHKFDEAGQHGLFLVPNACVSPVRCVGKLVAEIATAMPLGMLFMLVAYRRRFRLTGTGAFWIGLAIGLAIEGMQFLLVSGVSEGASILTRGIGIWLGARLMTLPSGLADRWRPLLPGIAAAAAIPYFILVLALNRWFDLPWQGIGAAMETWQRLNFIPFFYHYYVPESVAVASLVSIVGLYSPIGAGILAWRSGQSRPVSRSVVVPVLLAVGVAFIAESGKLFLAGAHPDPTNLLLAALAAALAYRILYWFFFEVENRPSSAAYEPGEEDVEPAREVQGQEGRRVQSHPFKRTMAALAGLAAIWLLWDFPDFRLVLLLGGMAYAAVLWRWPAAWMIAVPAVVAVVNLMPWTGRIFPNTFDMVMLISVAVVLWRSPLTVSRLVLPRAFRRLLILFCLSFVAALIIGVFPLSTFDGNVLSGYTSHYNSLRVARGLGWALVALGLIAHTITDRKTLVRLFTIGILLGLAGVVSAVIRERLVFTGLFDFSTVYRVVGSFASMHIGGGDIEAYLVLTVPLIFGLSVAMRDRWLRMAVLLVVAAGIYSLFVTYSRSGYLGLAVGLGILFVMRLAQRQGAKRFPLGAAGIGVILAVLAGLVYALLQGGYIERRFASADNDLQRRIDHWSHVLDLRLPTVSGRLFGSGLGRYPETYLLDSYASGIPRGVAFVKNENNDRYLRLLGSTRIFVDQRISVLPYQQYRIEVTMRGDTPGTRLEVLLCEKSLLYSHSCRSKTILYDTPVADSGNWQHYSINLDSRDIGAGGLLLGRPVSLSIFNPVTGSILDIDSVALYDPQGRQMLDNGSFQAGLDHWLITADEDHRPWHTDNLWVLLLFEQGWLGMLSFALMLLYVLGRLVRLGGLGVPATAEFVSSITGFAAASLFISPLDSPRIAFLFFLTLFVAMLTERSGDAAAQIRRRGRG